MSLYIVLLYYIYHLCFTCIDFYDLSAWGGCWFVVYIGRFIYKFLNVCPFDYTTIAGSGKVGPVNQVNHTSWVAVVTPTDRPKSVRNCYVIELFCGVVCVVTLPCWCRGFCHRTESDPFLFLLTKNIKIGFWPAAPMTNRHKMHNQSEFTCKRDVTLAVPRCKIGCSLGYMYLSWKFCCKYFIFFISFIFMQMK